MQLKPVHNSESAAELRSLREQLTFHARVRDTGCSDIAIAGMGDSGTAGRIFQELYYAKPVPSLDDCKPIHIIDDCHIPRFIGKQTLFIAISYSGNTKETLAATEEARDRGARIVTISSGGSLCKLGDDNIVVPGGLQPRAALGYLMMPLLRGFRTAKMDELYGAEKLVAELDRCNGECLAHAEAILESDRVPCIFSAAPFRSVAYRWKTQLNLNGKVLAFSNHFSELNYSDIVALSETYGKDRFYFLALGSDSAVMKRAIELVSSLTDTELHVIAPRGPSNVEKALYLIHYGDWLSFHLGALRGKDQMDVSIMEALNKGISDVRDGCG
jgi:glucose/mannose-6-phosphate isomerase